MPPRHRHYLEWTPERFESWATKIGPETERLISAVMARYRHPALGYRSCLGILRLGDQYPKQRVEAAARRAVTLNACSYQSLKSILKNNLDGTEPESAPAPKPPLDHPNLRGPNYFDPGAAPHLQ